MRDVEFRHIFDLNSIQLIQDKFSEATGVASVITDCDRDPITTPTNFCGLCAIIRSTEKGREKCQKSDSVIGRKNIKGPMVHKCYSLGLWDAGASICVDGKHIANWMIGQVKDDSIDESRVIEYAKEIGADETAMLEAFRKVPEISYDQFQKIANVLFLLANKISEKAFLNYQLTEALKKAEESDKMKSAFIANISHEIRTPLNGILGFASLLTEDDINLEDIHKYAEIINKSGMRLLGLINNVIDLSKIESHKMTVNNFEYLPAHLISDVVLQYEALAKKKSLVIHCSSDETYDKLKHVSDCQKVMQILSNLTNNAIKFTKAGYIDVGFYVNDNKIHYFVKDTGIGIPEVEIEKVFDRFYQVESNLNRNYEGSGLGLALCKSISEMLGGQLSVESKSGEGSTFTLSLPL